MGSTRPTMFMFDRMGRQRDHGQRRRWVKRRHPFTGRTYFEDLMTGDKSWVHPEQAQMVAEKRAALAARREAMEAKQARARAKYLAQVRRAQVDEREQAATAIQAAFRGHLVRKANVLAHLTDLQAIVRKVDELRAQYDADIMSGCASAKDAAAYSELLMHFGLLKLDAVSSGGSDLVRSRRRQLIRSIEHTLSLLDAYTPSEHDNPFYDVESEGGEDDGEEDEWDEGDEWEDEEDEWEEEYEIARPDTAPAAPAARRRH